MKKIKKNIDIGETNNRKKVASDEDNSDSQTPD